MTVRKGFVRHLEAADGSRQLSDELRERVEQQFGKKTAVGLPRNWDGSRSEADAAMIPLPESVKIAVRDTPDGAEAELTFAHSPNVIVIKAKTRALATARARLRAWF